MQGLWKIAVDTAVLANGATIAAYLTSAAGTLLTHTTNGARQALDTYDAAVKAEDSAHASGDLGAFVLGVRNDAGTAFGVDGDYVPLSIDSTGALRVNASVDFAGDYAEDSAHVSGAVGLFQLAVRRDVRTSGTSADGDYASVNVNAVGELWVKDTDLLTELLDQGITLDSILADTATIDSNLAALTKLEDAAHTGGDAGIQALAVRKDAAGTSTSADGDYASLIAWSNGELKTVDIVNTAVLQQEISVGTLATQLPTTALVGRKRILIQNGDVASVWVGSSTVTTAGATGGIRIPAGGYIEIDAGPACAIYAIASGLPSNVRILEAA